MPTPKLRLLDEASAAALAQADEAVGEAVAACGRAEAGARETIAAWIAGTAPLPDAFAAAGGMIPGELVRYAFDGRAADGRFTDALGSQAAATSPADNTVVSDARGGAPCTAVQLTGDHPVTTPVGNFRRSEPFTVAAWIKPATRHDRAVIFHRSKAWTDAASRAALATSSGVSQTRISIVPYSGLGRMSQ